jgi:hypothetical protein
MFGVSGAAYTYTSSACSGACTCAAGWFCGSAASSSTGTLCAVRRARHNVPVFGGMNRTRNSKGFPFYLISLVESSCFYLLYLYCFEVDVFVCFVLVFSCEFVLVLSFFILRHKYILYLYLYLYFHTDFIWCECGRIHVQVGYTCSGLTAQARACALGYEPCPLMRVRVSQPIPCATAGFYCPAGSISDSTAPCAICTYGTAAGAVGYSSPSCAGACALTSGNYCPAPTALAACCGFDLCHKYILYLYLYLYFPRAQIAALASYALPALRAPR